MFEVTKGNMKILFESPFLVADYVYKNTNISELSKKVLNECIELEECERVLIDYTVVKDSECILIEKVS